MTPIRLLRSLLAAASGAMFVLAGAHAAAPQVKTQAAGFYRMMLGDIEITALSDGTVALQPKQPLTNTFCAEGKGYAWVPIDYDGLR